MDAFICVNGQPQEYFAIPVTPSDAECLGIEYTQDSKVQQAYEALALLVALRQWKYFWARTRAVVHVAMDNMAALSMVCRMQPHSATLGVIAREMALDICDSVYEPQLVSHLPGVANVTADALSRRFQPGTQYHVPQILSAATEIVPAKRDPSWWRALTASRRSHDGE